MKQVIYKYPIALTPEQRITLPNDARVLSVQLQDGKPMLWALHDLPNDQTSMRTHEVYIIGTGWEINEPVPFTADDFKTTIQVRGLVWHIFVLRSTRAA